MIAITEPSGASRSAFATAARWLAGQILLISGVALAFSAGLYRLSHCRVMVLLNISVVGHLIQLT